MALWVAKNQMQYVSACAAVDGMKINWEYHRDKGSFTGSLEYVSLGDTPWSYIPIGEEGFWTDEKRFHNNIKKGLYKTNEKKN